MRILLTGASSFTGMWFAEALVAAGHEVVAPLLRPVADYDALRGLRVARVAAVARVVPGLRFGDEGFLALAGGGDFDVLCHHGARVEGYRDRDFDVTGAVADNTHALDKVLAVMAARGLRAMVMTGSVFEADEGAGEMPREAFSPYGLSKSLSFAVARFRAAQAGVPLGKFVIANPFGPFEEPRFCAYLMKCWAAGSAAGVNTPAYLRDNIHVDLLARAYAGFVADIAGQRRDMRLGPIGYIETQGQFAGRFAGAMRNRLGLDCALSLAEQRDFAEPLARINTDRVDTAALGWDEGAAWDGIAAYYRGKIGR